MIAFDNKSDGKACGDCHLRRGAQCLAFPHTIESRWGGRIRAEADLAYYKGKFMRCAECLAAELPGRVS